MSDLIDYYRRGGPCIDDVKRFQERNRLTLFFMCAGPGDANENHSHLDTLAGGEGVRPERSCQALFFPSTILAYCQYVLSLILHS